MGCEITSNQDQFDENTLKEVKNTSKEMKNEVETKKYEEIANAIDLSEMEYKILKKNKDLSIEEKRSIEKYELSTLFDVPLESINVKFVKIYNTKKIKDIVNSSTINLEEQMKKINQRKDSLDDPVLSNGVVWKKGIGLEIIQEMTKKKCWQDVIGIEIIEQDLIHLLDSILGRLNTKLEKIKEMFQLQNSFPKKKEFKHKLHFINSILYKSFSIKLKATLKKKRLHLINLNWMRSFQLKMDIWFVIERIKIFDWVAKKQTYFKRKRKYLRDCCAPIKLLFYCEILIHISN